MCRILAATLMLVLVAGCPSAGPSQADSYAAIRAACHLPGEPLMTDAEISAVLNLHEYARQTGVTKEEALLDAMMTCGAMWGDVDDNSFMFSMCYSCVEAITNQVYR